MNGNRTKKIQYLITGSLIAAAYVGLTFLSNAFGLAYGPVQLRLSEVLTILPVFTPAAIPGLTVGCFIANIASFNALDMIFGTLATLSAACLTYFLRGVRLKGIPVAALLPPVIINMLVIGAEISLFFLPADAGIWAYAVSALEVGAGEFIVCFVFGIPFYMVVRKYNIFKETGAL